MTSWRRSVLSLLFNSEYILNIDLVVKLLILKK